MDKKHVLILGLGNYLMGDEGLGVHLARALENQEWPDEVEIVDGGTGGFLLMNQIESYEHVIMIDATMDNKKPGTINLIKPKFAKDFPQAMSTHEIGLKDVIQSMQLLGTLPVIHLFTVSIELIQPLTVELSEAIQQIMPDLARKIRQLVFQLVPTEVI
ncbi:MAG TPA: hydrogenase maturation protease [Saprospiraceae bacterium]|nr:hydrogenase maturation protease [Saprospiraceae bacterium]HPG05381.1 hydrogenase maturation protease [Saprospiraceae bacterium]HPQ99710.1 hydrogenase maturation protease [Saprospiraceae bacterium]HQU54630.1 hydrogenase maturation protease [Saprospiraceae bacterium]HRV83833.1 hydrogenase maturation protease [Saprospiraceae bacterium]